MKLDSNLDLQDLQGLIHYTAPKKEHTENISSSSVTSLPSLPLSAGAAGFSTGSKNRLFPLTDTLPRLGQAGAVVLASERDKLETLNYINRLSKYTVIIEQI